MATPDKVFKQAYAWFRKSIEQASALVPAQQAQASSLAWQMLVLPSPPLADPDLNDFSDAGIDAESLAVATWC